MVWQPGQSGNPQGRRAEKPYTDALRMEAAALLNDPKAPMPPKGSLRWIARNQLFNAGKDTAAANHVADRLEGKVPQAIGQSPDLEPLQLIVTGVPRALEDKAAQAIDVTPDELDRREQERADKRLVDRDRAGLNSPELSKHELSEHELPDAGLGDDTEGAAAHITSPQARSSPD